MGNYHDHSDSLILSPTSQTPSFLPCLSPSLFPFLKYLLSTYYEADVVLDSGDTRLRLELRWPCVRVRLEYSVLSFIASFMLPPAAKASKSMPLLNLAMVLLLPPLQLRSSW